MAHWILAGVTVELNVLLIRDIFTLQDCAIFAAPPYHTASILRTSPRGQASPIWPLEHITCRTTTHTHQEGRNKFSRTILCFERPLIVSRTYHSAWDSFYMSLFINLVVTFRWYTSVSFYFTGHPDMITLCKTTALQVTTLSYLHKGCGNRTSVAHRADF